MLLVALVALGFGAFLFKVLVWMTSTRGETRSAASPPVASLELEVRT